MRDDTFYHMCMVSVWRGGRRVAVGTRVGVQLQLELQAGLWIPGWSVEGRRSHGAKAKASRHLELDRGWVVAKIACLVSRRASSTTMLHFHLQYAFPHSRSRGIETQHLQTGTRAPRRAPGRRTERVQ